jgi:hypothetical protein
MNVPRTTSQVNRVVAWVNMNGVVDTTISLETFFAPSAVTIATNVNNTISAIGRRDGIPRGSSDVTARAAASFDGQRFWVVGRYVRN